MSRRSPYLYQPKAARYRDPATGRYITRGQVRQWVDQNIAKSQARIQQLSEALREGKISLAEWQAGMREEIKRVHLGSEMLVRGGKAQMAPADFGRVGQRVRVQYGYLNDFTEQLRRGGVRTDGSFLSRAKMYAASARTGYHESERQQLGALGYTQERSLLHPAEHCGTCLGEAARGWSPIGTLIPIGERDCLSNCKCTIAYA